MTQTSELKAVVFDWAGTVVDFGSRAPMGVFVETFARFGVELTVAEARGPMGLAKRDHVAALLREPAIAERWKLARGSAPAQSDVDAVYDMFVPLNAQIVGDYAELIPGVTSVVATLRARGVKIGSTTGYTRDIMARLSPLAAERGFAPDNLVCAGDLSAGRPTPLMMYRTFADLGVFPPSAVVKVDDTEPGIAEGLAAGSITVGIAMTGNCCGLSEPELTALSNDERTAIRTRAEKKLRAAGAHAVIDGVSDLLPVLDRFFAPASQAADRAERTTLV